MQYHHVNLYVYSVGGEPQVVELPAVEEVKPVVKKSTGI
jgi:hypothetical protein